MGKSVNVSVDSDSRSLDENDGLIRKFSKKVKKLGLMDLLREKRYFISKSEKKRIKKRKKRRLSREDTAKRNKYYLRINNEGLYNVSLQKHKLG